MCVCVCVATYACMRIRGSVRGVMVIVVGNGHSDTSSNPGRDRLHFTYHQYPWERYESNYSPSSRLGSSALMRQLV